VILGVAFFPTSSPYLYILIIAVLFLVKPSSDHVQLIIDLFLVELVVPFAFFILVEQLIFKQKSTSILFDGIGVVILKGSLDLLEERVAL